MRRFLLIFLLATLRAAAQDPVSVMIVGDFHMSNPDRDLHNVQSDDMLAPNDYLPKQAPRYFAAGG